MLPAVFWKELSLNEGAGRWGCVQEPSLQGPQWGMVTQAALWRALPGMKACSGPLWGGELTATLGPETDLP